ncbi:protein involved in catabolism of external DNA [Legionella lansingensis]|uniref:Ribosomal RNA large subunit methyltransferase J n=1 Tax=Legionella lansingensis TaxID=45067 RepID=A0A0W0VTV3_9GAMM|nr:23S rRNA (adenine(2030)-N(6))-methyltransferase RlmJ [Legionella lansingensis]KTD23413.1 protein involved in catabolism of external DNA [Legionella lansingensis]SNV49590.1 protein involved in catabolism of external DNA [Legionella lansingensis]
MLSYQHGYHAGNFADVVKHLTLSRILNYMIQKEKPLFYLETHAGRGIYDLQDSQAVKTREYLQGIHLLWQEKNKLSTLFSPYLQCISDINPTGSLRFYPGSPALAIALLRPQDRIYCCELHPREFEHLQTLAHPRKRVFYEHHDGLFNLNALLPPPERRAIIFLDPSYEIKQEYKEIPKAIKAAYQKFSTGVFCLWYPLVDKKLHEQLLRGMENIGAPNTLRIEFSLNPMINQGMTGCGLWIINPPYALTNEMKTILNQLCSLINPGTSSFIVED